MVRFILDKQFPGCIVVPLSRQSPRFLSDDPDPDLLALYEDQEESENANSRCFFFFFSFEKFCMAVNIGCRPAPFRRPLCIYYGLENCFTTVSQFTLLLELVNRSSRIMATTSSQKTIDVTSPIPGNQVADRYNSPASQGSTRKGLILFLLSLAQFLDTFPISGHIHEFGSRCVCTTHFVRPQNQQCKLCVVD